MSDTNEAARQQAVSHIFMRLHKEDFNPCEANANILGRKMQELSLPWSLEGLEQAFALVKNNLSPVPRSQAELDAEDAAAQAKAEADAKAVLEQEAIASLPGHGVSGIPQFKTVAEIHQIPRDEYRRLYHSHVFGELFRARVNEVYARSGKKYVTGRF